MILVSFNDTCLILLTCPTRGAKWYIIQIRRNNLYLTQTTTSGVMKGPANHAMQGRHMRGGTAPFWSPIGDCTTWCGKKFLGYLFSPGDCAFRCGKHFFRVIFSQEIAPFGVEIFFWDNYFSQVVSFWAAKRVYSILYYFLSILKNKWYPYKPKTLFCKRGWSNSRILHLNVCDMFWQRDRLELSLILLLNTSDMCSKRGRSFEKSLRWKCQRIYCS